MTAPTLVEFEQALIARLQGTLLGPTGPCRRVQAYQGELAELLKESGFDDAEVWVHLDRGDDDGHTVTSVKREIEVHIFVAVSNYRGASQARQGVEDADEVGVYELLDDIDALLWGHDLDLEMKPLKPMGFHSIVAPEQAAEIAASVYRSDWKAEWYRQQPDHEADDAVFHEYSDVEIDIDGDDSPELESEVQHT